ncbi:hypothetical protein [Aurantiacibacter odishensis]|uniref:hypothetical protein n=1 Tax=Aurantiacibacter odishensis TaxID=1155476 RepID=UPI0013C45DF3|nr:hypothetical protein [Aurantiacibacter odishensis]
MRPAALAIILALAACAPEPEDEQLTTLPANDGEENPAPPPPSTAISAIETLAGEWRVAGIDGEPFDEPYGLALSADGEEIWWEPRCANFAFSYRIEGLRITTGEGRPSNPVEPGAPPPPVCTVGIPPRLNEVARALDVADTVGRLPSNGVLIEGGGHSITLFSQ